MNFYFGFSFSFFFKRSFLPRQEMGRLDWTGLRTPIFLFDSVSVCVCPHTQRSGYRVVRFFSSVLTVSQFSAVSVNSECDSRVAASVSAIVSAIVRCECECELLSKCGVGTVQFASLCPTGSACSLLPLPRGSAIYPFAVFLPPTLYLLGQADTNKQNRHHIYSPSLSFLTASSKAKSSHDHHHRRHQGLFRL